MIINNVRLTWMHFDQPKAAVEGAKPKYSVTLILPKNDPQVPSVKAAIKAAKEDKFGTKTIAGLKNPLRDGDAVDDDGNRLKGNEFAGAYFITAGSYEPVDVVAGKARTPAAAEHKVWGNFGSVKVRFAGFDQSVNKGVSAWLQGVWITRKGEPLGAAAEPWAEVEAEDFSTIAETAVANGKQDDDMF